jgi:hypothetical protein
MTGLEPNLPPSERVVRAPADAVESAVSHLGGQPRRQRVLGEAIAAGAAAALVIALRRLRR